MWPFKKKDFSPTLIDPLPCRHKWKDFPWYIEGKYYIQTRSEVITIIEPYVCIHCKERKNVCLLRAAYDGVTEKEANHLFEENESEYKEYLKPRAVVEDMISDFQLVDRTYLELADSLHPGRSILQISTQNEN